MARLDHFLPSGLISTTYTGGKQGLFHLEKFFKRASDRFHVPYVDDCCTADVTNLPIRYNRTAGKLQYYNPDNDTWTNLTTF